MDLNIIYKVVVLVILISIQYTLNLILREIKGLRITVMKEDIEKMFKDEN